jgi:hypothetical protein
MEGRQKEKVESLSKGANTLGVYFLRREEWSPQPLKGLTRCLFSERVKLPCGLVGNLTSILGVPRRLSLNFTSMIHPSLHVREVNGTVKATDGVVLH